jgi:ubiquinone/menaquinone biosynthesis C-methylase UbiE
VDTADLRLRQQAMWARGDFSVIGWNTTFPGELLCEAVDLRAGQRVIDLATGSGSAALAAARRNTEVLGIDYVPALIARAQDRARAEGLPARFMVCACEDVPEPAASFQVVLSVFGSMFAPDHQAAAAEMLRLCAPGGRIGMCCWTPDGFWGEGFALQARYSAPVQGSRPPTLWGNPDYLAGLFADQWVVTACTRRTARFRFRDNAHWIDVFTEHFGPIMTTLGNLPELQRADFLAELDALLTRFNLARDGSLVLGADYLEVISERC